MQINLLKETLDCLASNKKSADEVLWVQWEDFYCSFAEFAEAADFEYNNGYGGNEVVMSLKVVGDNWWLERGEYDGSEWWEFKARPKQPSKARTPVMEDIRCN